MKRRIERNCGRVLLYVTLSMTASLAGKGSDLVPASESASAEVITGPLRVHPSNPRYFADATGRAVYLTGSHVWCNLQDTSAFMGTDPAADPPPVFPYEQHLQWLKSANHNFIRLWMWEHSAWFPTVTAKAVFAPLWFARPGPRIALDGKPAFDLTTFNPEFFTRLRDRVQLAQQYGIYVGVMLFQGWSIDTAGKGQPNPWRGHPFHPANNINNIDGAPDGNGEGTQWHTLNAPPAVRALQEAYIRELIDTLNEFDNVLWEVANESSGSREWHYWVVNFIREYESRKPKQHLIGLTAGGTLRNPDLFSSPADWVSPNARDDDYKFNPPAADGRKVIILDTDHLWGLGGDSDWVWKSFMRGHHPIYMDAMQFMVKGGVLEDAPGSPGARKAMGDTLQWSRKIDLAAMKPMGSLCSTNYCLANPGSEYLIYRHGVGPVDVQLGDGSYTATWFDVERGSAVISPDPVEGGGPRSIVSPFAGPAVLHLSARAGTSPAPPQGPAPVALARGWISGWTDRKSIVIPSAHVTGDHTAFPALIQFSNDPHLSSRTRADGSDLVFTAGDGMTRLAHSIQNFDAGGGNLTTWVKVPRLSDTSDTTLYLYFGNSGSGYEQTPQDVWSGGYTGVWHLNDAQSDVRDATSFQHHALRSSTEVEPAGKISRARRFVRSLASFVEIPATPALTRPSITAEAWIQASPGSLPLDVISIGDNVTVRVEPDGRPSFYIFDGSYRWTTAGHSVSGAFHHVAGVYDAASERLTVYVDGEPAGTASASQIRYSADRSIAFGMNAYPSSAYHFDGVIDEVRLSSVPRSAGWMRTQFRNQNAPATFHHIGPIETHQE